MFCQALAILGDSRDFHCRGARDEPRRRDTGKADQGACKDGSDRHLDNMVLDTSNVNDLCHL
jgi:hypothetical protein